MYDFMNIPYLPFGSPTTPPWNRYGLGHMLVRFDFAFSWALLRIFSYDPTMMHPWLASLTIFPTNFCQLPHLSSLSEMIAL